MDAITYSKIKKMSPQFLVADIEHSIEFYTEKLGFDVDFRYEDFYAGLQLLSNLIRRNGSSGLFGKLSLSLDNHC